MAQPVTQTLGCCLQCVQYHTAAPLPIQLHDTPEKAGETVQVLGLLPPLWETQSSRLVALAWSTLATVTIWGANKWKITLLSLYHSSKS